MQIPESRKKKSWFMLHAMQKYLFTRHEKSMADLL